MEESHRDDVGTVRRVLAGERDAYAVLVRQYEPRVRGLCRGLLGNAAQADDAAQEAFIKAYTALPKFRGQAAFSTWLYRIAVNHCRDMLRQSARRRSESWEQLVEESGDRVEMEVAGLQTPAETGIDAERVHRELDSLPEIHRTILVLRELQGLSYEELAAALDCSLDAVKGRLKRARQELAQRLRHFFQPRGVQTDRGGA